MQKGLPVSIRKAPGVAVIKYQSLASPKQ
jgi:hypothetical protein